ncbi:hypothetical protein F7725_017853 [Dissostichus mawsoni]|uniref:Uncharacterized protein n=1 Tax=Dissostichus mawsoni TaxID=36200 RepID=A0A7J5XPS2_DISMA|nr:hypothetical protein F7725_017853 [Dissostichus mawsoni]
MIRSTHKQQLHANITVPLLTRAGCNYIMSPALTSRGRLPSPSVLLLGGILKKQKGRTTSHNDLMDKCTRGGRGTAPFHKFLIIRMQECAPTRPFCGVFGGKRQDRGCQDKIGVCPNLSTFVSRLPVLVLRGNSALRAETKWPQKL